MRSAADVATLVGDGSKRGPLVGNAALFRSVLDFVEGKVEGGGIARSRRFPPLVSHRGTEIDRPPANIGGESREVSIASGGNLRRFDQVERPGGARQDREPNHHRLSGSLDGLGG